MTTSLHLPILSPSDNSLKPEMSDTGFSPSAGSYHESPSNQDVKIIPKELTSQGTTPSGKPRLFVCSTCTRAFARLEHLRRHERSHTKEKPFICGVCQRKFSRRDLLLRHAQKLHAGCADAITRLRRKSLKSNSISSASDYLDGESSIYSPSGNGHTGAETKSSNYSTPATTDPRGSLDNISFNLNSFSSRNQDSHFNASPMKASRSNSVKDSSLQRQLFDKKNSRNRGASFSAQSGNNYAMVSPHYSDNNSVDHVEFSTPQFLPSFTNDEDSWLNNLCSIPGMSASTNKTDYSHNNGHYSIENEIPKHTAMLGGGLFPALGRSDSVASNNSINTVESTSANAPFMSHRPSMTNATSNGQVDMKVDYGDTGYSFYDIPESMMGSGSAVANITRPLSPIEQEFEDDLMLVDNTNQQQSTGKNDSTSQISGGEFNLNFLNDIDELGQDFDVGNKFLPAGYSFYGDNPSVSSSGLDSNSPVMLSPSAIHNSQNMFGAKPTSTLKHEIDSRTSYENQIIVSRGTDGKAYSKNRLFTKNVRRMINKALSNYPISDVMSPSIPSNEKLEFFLKTFIERYLSYSPFIHPSKLNEYEIMSMTSDENPSNDSARVCMPLLVATMGALLANSKNDSEHLYEASRRTIHIYLESRKNQRGANKSPNQANPLWLIQSLTLSVIYGLFSDNENNVYIVIRQLNALNSLVKTSSKNSNDVFFSITGEDEMFYNAVKTDNYSQALGLVDINEKEDVKFRNSINMQSQVRVVLSIYQLTNFILMMFNVPLTLSANDLSSLILPNTCDEFLWRFNSYSEFAIYVSNAGISRGIDFYLTKDESNTINFRNILSSLCLGDFNGTVVSKLSNLSKIGFNTIVKGFYEFMQYEDFKYMDVGFILDNLTLFLDSSERNPETRHPTNGPRSFEKSDYALLVNFVKICSIVDSKLVKEQSWLKNYDELNKNFHMFLSSMETISDANLSKIIDYCMLCTKLILFRAEQIDMPYTTMQAGNSSPENQHQRSVSFKTLIDDSFANENELNADFERKYGLQVHEDILSMKTPIHSQILFHIFVIFAIFAIHIAKRNNPDNQLAKSHNMNETVKLNQKFLSLMRLLTKFERFLKAQVESSKVDSEISNVFLFSSGLSDELLTGKGLHEANAGESEQLSNLLSYSLNKTLYVLKIGELMMRFLYEHNIKVSIFKKLSGSLSQIRKYLIDEESKIMP